MPGFVQSSRSSRTNAAISRAQSIVPTHTTVRVPARPPSNKNASMRTDKRFTCRDGFHLKDRNDDRRAAIDQQLFPRPTEAPSAEPNSNQAPSSRNNAGEEGVVDESLSSFDCERMAIADLLQRAAESKRLQDDNSEEQIPSKGLDEEQHAQENEPEMLLEGPTLQLAHAVATSSKHKPYAEWLIYRPRASKTPRRKQQQMEAEVQEVLSAATGSSKANAMLLPAPPSAKVARRSRGFATRTAHRLLSPLPQEDTERYLLSSRESSNRDVDRLLVELFQVPSTDTDSCAAATMLRKRTKLRFATRRSELREQSAVALRHRNLQSRMDELRSVPQVLDRVLEMARIKQQNLVKAHGENLILKNKTQTHRLLQMPPQTPMYPSRAGQMQHQALQRKLVLDETQEIAVRAAVNRWQKRRLEHKRQAQQRYRGCQWLLLVQLAQASAQWRSRFQLLKEKHDFMLHVSMAKKIQRIWRQHVLLRSNSLSLFRMSSSRSIRSPFYRMPIVMKGICLLQFAMRRWMERKRDRLNRQAVDMIVTAWFEFQDVKFRRLILRFRKRVRDFQIMWRTWRSITDARIKLLLLVWAKLEKKAKRRYGVLSPSSAGDDSEAEASRSMSLVHVLRNKLKEPKQIEGIHRHLRNGGTVLTPLSVGSPSPAMASVVSAFSPRSLSPTSLGSISSSSKARIMNKVRHHKELQMQMQDEFHVAMQDFYATRNNHHSNASALLPEVSPATLAGASPSSPLRRAPTSPRKFLLSVFATTAAGPMQHTTEKVPLSVRVSLLRQLISDKRRAFRARREKNRCVSSWPLELVIIDAGRVLTVLRLDYTGSNGSTGASTCGAWSSATTCWRSCLRTRSSSPAIRSSFCCTTCPSSRCSRSCSARNSKLTQVQPTRASRSRFPRPVLPRRRRRFRLMGLSTPVGPRRWAVVALGRVRP